MITYFLLTFMAFCISLLLTPIARKLAFLVGAVDVPGVRKIHTTIKPRLGGVSIVFSVLLTLSFVSLLRTLFDLDINISFNSMAPIFLGGSIVFLIGIWDDVRSLTSKTKFFFQATAAIVAISLGIRIEYISILGSDSLYLNVFSLPITFLWIIGITNAFNLIDGLDGLATGLAIIAASTSAIIFSLQGDTHSLLILLPLTGALVGFLPYNFNPAKIFLGDSGSLTIGYILSVMTIKSSQKAAPALAIVIPLLILGLPIMDTVLSMLRRFIKSLKQLESSETPSFSKLLKIKYMFQPDRRHIHHRLLATGFSHRNAVLLLYGLAAGLSILALLSVFAQYRNIGLVLVIVSFATYIGIHKLGYDEFVFFRANSLLNWYAKLNFNRLFFLGFIDIFLISTAYWLAFLLKYETLNIEGELLNWYRNSFPLVLLTQLGVFYAAGLYRGVWRAAEIYDLIKSQGIVFLATTLSCILVFLSIPPQGAFSFFCVDALLLGTLIVGIRSSYRILECLEHSKKLLLREPANDPVQGPALIYGAGRSGQLVLHELLHNASFKLRPIGFLDDNPALHGRFINFVPILGSIDHLPSLLKSQEVSAIIISSRKLREDKMQTILSTCRMYKLPVLQMYLQLEEARENSIIFTPSNGKFASQIVKRTLRS